MATFWTARAQDGTAYNYLNIPTSSHAYALGGVNISVVDDDINLYEQNPALLGPEVDMQAGVDWSRFRRAIPDSVHGFGRYRAWWSGVRFLW